MVFVSCLLLLLTVGLAYQRWRHGRHLAKIPLRIHVNGSRGKSSVTRLIAAGLRAGGVRTIAKTTGTRPRFIYDDGTEAPVARAGDANIIEQVRIVRRAAQLGAEAIVVECMAIKPELQALLENRIIRSTHSVITNVRSDHLAEMGPTLADVARSLGQTIARDGRCFTAERDYLDALCEQARERGADVSVALSQSIGDSVLGRFSYVEHAENVALALAVCTAIGVDWSVALTGMVEATPDPGVMRIYRVSSDGREIVFINGLAVNDPDSYALAWERLTPRLPRDRRVLGLAVCRPDRIERSQQLGELLATRLPVDACVVAGKATAPFLRRFRSANASGRNVLDMEGATPEEIYTTILTYSGEAPLVVFGVGNIVGLGEEIVEQFRSRASESSVNNPHRGANATPNEVRVV